MAHPSKLDGSLRGTLGRLLADIGGWLYATGPQVLEGPLIPCAIFFVWGPRLVQLRAHARKLTPEGSAFWGSFVDLSLGVEPSAQPRLLLGAEARRWFPHSPQLRLLFLARLTANSFTRILAIPLKGDPSPRSPSHPPLKDSRSLWPGGS